LVSVSGSFSVKFSVSDPAPESSISIYLVVDQDITGIIRVEANANAGSNTVSIDTSAFPPGKPFLWFSAVNELVFVSDPVDLELVVLPGSQGSRPPEPATRELSGPAVVGIAVGGSVLGIMVIVVIVILVKKGRKDKGFVKINSAELKANLEIL
jgi:hypothetical protein